MRSVSAAEAAGRAEGPAGLQTMQKCRGRSAREVGRAGGELTQPRRHSVLDISPCPFLALVAAESEKKRERRPGRGDLVGR